MRHGCACLVAGCEPLTSHVSDMWDPSAFLCSAYSNACGRFVEHAHKLHHNINPMRPLSGFTLDSVEIVNEKDREVVTALYQKMHPRSRSIQEVEAAYTNDEQRAASTY